jgi:hypothetical protein
MIQKVERGQAWVLHAPAFIESARAHGVTWRAPVQ